MVLRDQCLLGQEVQAVRALIENRWQAQGPCKGDGGQPTRPFRKKRVEQAPRTALAACGLPIMPSISAEDSLIRQPVVPGGPDGLQDQQDQQGPSAVNPSGNGSCAAPRESPKGTAVWPSMAN